MDYAEYMNAVNNNGVAEGISCKIFPQLVAGTEPFYRLYSTAATAHLYTASFSEVVNSVNNLGYKLEGIAGYIYKNDTCGGVPYYLITILRLPAAKLMFIRRRQQNAMMRSSICHMFRKGLQDMWSRHEAAAPKPLLLLMSVILFFFPIQSRPQYSVFILERLGCMTWERSMYQEFQTY